MSDFTYGKYAVEMISAVLNNTVPVEPESGFDWYAFKSFCEKHCISNIVAYSINKLDISLPQEIKAYFEEIVYQSLAKEARVEVEITDILNDFEENGIPHMLLKGSVIKNLYPQPDMRSMCDVDILVGKHLDSAMEVMYAHSFELKERANLHDCYFKKPFLNVELHSSLVDEELTELNAYFKTGFERAKLQGNFKYRYILSDEDFYIFLLAHFAKHFKRMGTGIRSVADIWAYLKHHQSLNFDYIDKEIKKIGLLKFSKRIEKIAYNWFSKKIVDENDPIESYIISSGAYGNYLNLELNRFLQNDAQQGNYKINKIKYYLRVIFPDFKYMSARYPSLKKAKLFMPVYWFVRIIHTLFKSKGSIRYRLGGVSKSDKEALDKFSDFN